MPWLSLLTGLVQLLGAVAKYLGDKRLMDAGAAEAIAKGQTNVIEDLRRVAAAREVLRNPDSDRAERVRKRFQRPE